MFVYGPSKISDEPSLVSVTLKGETTPRRFPLIGGVGAIVAPGGELVIVATPPEPPKDPRKTPMRVLWAFPWDSIQSVQFEYDTPFPDLAEVDEDQELKDLEEMIQRPDKPEEQSVN